MKRQAAKESGFNFRVRVVLLGTVMFLAVGTIVWRAVDLQILQADRLARLARQEHHKVVNLTPSRGLIKDRRGEVLAASVQVESIFARPARIKDVQAAARGLAGVLKTDRQKLVGLLSGKSSFVWLRRQVDPGTATKVRALGLAGVGVMPESRRYYPQLELAAHLIGFSGRDAEGLEGLERAYNATLKGRTSRSVVIRDAKGRLVSDPRSVREDREDGRDVVLTLDKTIQYLTEQALSRAVTDSGARGGMAVVLEVKTGRVLASAALPTFNPNIYRRYPESTWRNRVLTDPFEPGSVMKVFTVAAALEEGVFNTASVINCENGEAELGGRVVHDVHPHGELTLAEVLRYSSNIGVAKVGLALGPRKLRRNLNRFGFGRKTGFDLPGEHPGLLRSAGSWRTIDTANISFGQGIGVTALQLTSALAAVANNGVLLRPYVVAGIQDGRGNYVSRTRPTKVGLVMHPRTAAIVKRLMDDVVNAEGGTGSRARSASYRSAGKTGTAQKIDPEAGGYSKKNYLALFGGFAPVAEPMIAVLVVIDEPRTSIYGGSVAAPVFADIVEHALPLLGAPPAGTSLVRAAPAKSGNITINPVRIDDSPAGRISQVGGTMPVLIGMSLREALAVLAEMDMEATIHGSGQVVDQFPAPGSSVSGSPECRLTLAAEMS